MPRSLMWPDHQFLNQARAWFLKIDAVRIVGMRVRVCVCVCVCVCTCMCVCPCPRLLLTGGMIRRDMNLIQLVNKFYSCYMATVVVIVNGCGLSIDMRHRH